MNKMLRRGVLVLPVLLAGCAEKHNLQNPSADVYITGVLVLIVGILGFIFLLRG